MLPLATLLGLAERPGEGHALGALDPALCRALAATAALSPYTTICVTVTDPDGIAIGHGCVKPGRLARPPAGPAPPLIALPARINLTITTARLAALRARPETRPTRPPGPSGPPGPPGPPGQPETGWAFARRGPGPPGDPDWCGPWALTLPSGLELGVDLEPVPTFDCDHRHESRAYQPNATLRHLVQIRDHTCTFPPCNRHARESDFEHAVPYDQGGRTCACNAGARSRKCHRVKQSPGLERHPAQARLAPVDHPPRPHLHPRPQAIPRLSREQGAVGLVGQLVLPLGLGLVVQFGRRRAQAGRCFSIAASTSGSSGTVRGRNRASTVPSGPSRNFSKFHWTSPAAPSASGTAVSSS